LKRHKIYKDDLGYMEKAPVKTPPVLQVPPPVSKPETDHRRQMLWQVWLPFGIGLLAILALCVLVVLSAVNKNPNLTRWSDMSLIWMIALIFAPALLIALLLAGFVYLLTRILRILPAYAHLAQAYASYLAALVRFWLDRLVQPALRMQGAYAGWQALRKRLGPKRS
jgi:FtsH-binding integral membrane protein